MQTKSSAGSRETANGAERAVCDRVGLRRQVKPVLRAGSRWDDSGRIPGAAVGESLQERFGQLPPIRIVIETGTHSRRSADC
jgi:hypothetical protein